MRLSWSRCCLRYKSGQLPHASYPVHVCRLRFLRPAPNFGKTFGPSVTSGQSWAFEKASSLSEIGGRKVAKRPEDGAVMKSGISRGHLASTTPGSRGSAEHSPTQALKARLPTIAAQLAMIPSDSPQHRSFLPAKKMFLPTSGSRL